jgi:demethylmenaquinone methyltransferase/2-methoxy-6-polyprenyl-1,4-benzoquinol methylase
LKIIILTQQLLLCVRNFETLDKGLKEILRVLKPNGVFVILETSVPDKTLTNRDIIFYSKISYPS